MTRFIELISLAFKQKLDFLHHGCAVYNKKTQIIESIWSEHYKAVRELCRLQREYPNEADQFDIIEIY